MNRRNFLKSSAIAAGALLTPSLVLANYSNDTICLPSSAKALCDMWDGSDEHINAMSNLVDIAMNVKHEPLATVVGMLGYVMATRKVRFNLRNLNAHTKEEFNARFLKDIVGDCDIDGYREQFVAKVDAL